MRIAEVVRGLGRNSSDEEIAGLAAMMIALIKEILETLPPE